MITKKMIKDGFEKHLISIENEWNGCVGLCCKIGNEAFYFTGNENANLTTEEYWNSYTLEMTIDMLSDILKDIESAEKNGIDCTELKYYETVLS